jgi:hypothetical protein
LRRSELAVDGFELVETVASAYPRRGPGVLIGWYSAFRRREDDEPRDSTDVDGASR